MSLEIRSEVRDSYLFLTTAGDVTAEGILELGGAIRTACEEAGLNNAVIDCKGLVGALTVTELFETTPKFTRIVGPRIRVAYVNPPAEWSPADDQFSRNVSHNRGGHLEVFASIEDALTWFSES